MVEIGCLARFFNQYVDEVEFAKNNNFKLMQLWYDNRGLCLHEKDVKGVHIIKESKFPTIIHAVLNISEFEEHIPKLQKLLKELKHTELIIHPICEDEPITAQTLDQLNQKVKYALELLTPYGVTLYLENNSKLDPIFTDIDEIDYIFRENPTLEFILDIAHVDDLMTLEKMIQIKTPKILHIADRHFNITHEHLSIGEGEINFEYIFRNVLTDFNGRIILEILGDKEIVDSKEKILNILCNK